MRYSFIGFPLLISGLIGCQPEDDVLTRSGSDAGGTPAEADYRQGRMVDFVTVGFADNASFDTLAAGTLQGHPPRVAITTTIPFDGTKAPELPGRLNAWIDLWRQANPDKGLCWLESRLAGAKGLVDGTILSVDLSDADLPEAIRTTGALVERWATQVAGSADRWYRERRAREDRKRLLAGYHASLVSLEGRAVLLLSDSPIRAIAVHASEAYAKRPIE